MYGLTEEWCYIILSIIFKEGTCDRERILKDGLYVFGAKSILKVDSFSRSPSGFALDEKRLKSLYDKRTLRV